MNLFSHFEDGIFVGESTSRAPEFSAGALENIFDKGKVVVSLSKEEILECIQNDEILNRSKNKIRKTLGSIISHVELEY
jgi:hypothetical protein